jgi:hypothetical protein
MFFIVEYFFVSILFFELILFVWFLPFQDNVHEYRVYETESGYSVFIPLYFEQNKKTENLVLNFDKSKYVN